ncbi:MAG: AMP-binding protein, partial [bacterium]|nr:AMP-binding protein [bacterium]
ERSDELARHLRALGVVPETVVGIAAERGPELVVGLLGILKAGGVYLPLDPAHPADRLAFMLRDAGARVLLAGDSVAGRLPAPEEHGARVVSLEAWPEAPRGTIPGLTPWAMLSRPPGSGVGVCPSNLAYVIYTSGTTGRCPRGWPSCVGRLRPGPLTFHPLRKFCAGGCRRAAVHSGSSAFIFPASELRPKPFDLGQRFTMALFGPAPRLRLLRGALFGQLGPLFGLAPRLRFLRGALLGQLDPLLGLALRLRRFLLRRT